MGKAPVTLSELLYDARLTDTARIIGVHVAVTASEDEPVAIPYDEFAGILHGAPSGDTIARHVRLLEVHGYVKKSPGGRGSPVFDWCGNRSTPDICGLKQELSSAQMRSKVLHRTGADQQSQFADHTGSLPGTGADHTAPTSSSSKEPPPPPLDARAREFISKTESFVGCRGSLLDYLQERVGSERQLAYAQTVAGIIEESDERLWKSRDGKICIRNGRAKIISGCLNELRQGDEVGRYFPGSPGDVHNLQSKIRYKVKAETDAKRDAERRSTRGKEDGKTGARNGSFL